MNSRNENQHFLSHVPGGLGGGRTRAFVLCVILTFFGAVKPRTVGSIGQTLFLDTILTVSGSNNRITGFTRLNGGLELQGEHASCLFDAQLPISSLLDLRGGHLTLGSNLLLQHPLTIRSSGTIDAQGNLISLPQTGVLNIPEQQTAHTIHSFHQSKLRSSVTACAWSTSGDLVAFGTKKKGNQSQLEIAHFDGAALTTLTTFDMCETIRSLAWDPTSKLLAVGISSGTARDTIHLFAYDRTVRKLLPCTTGGLSVKDVSAVAFHPTGKYLAVASRKSKQQITIYLCDGKTLYEKCCAGFTQFRHVSDNALAWDPSGNYLLAGVAASSNFPELLLYYYNEIGLTLADSIDVCKSVTALSWAPDGIHVAFGVVESKCRQKVFLARLDRTEHSLKILHECRCDQECDVAGLSWSGSTGLLSCVSNADRCRGMLDIFSLNVTTTTLERVDSKIIPAQLSTTAWSADGKTLVVGDCTSNATLYRVVDEFTFYNAQLRAQSCLNVYVPLCFNGECSLDTNGRAVHFFDSIPLIMNATTLLEVRNTSVAFNTNAHLLGVDASSVIIFDDASLFASQGLHSRNVRLFLQNSVDLAGMFSFDAEVADGSKISLKMQSSIKGVWTICGHVVLQGNGCALNVSDAVFKLAPGATLEIADIHLKNCGAQLFSCSDDSCTVKLSQVTLNMVDDSTITKGHFIVNGISTVLAKNHKWTIAHDAHLTIDGVTLWQDVGEPISAHASDAITGNLSIINQGALRTVGVSHHDSSFYDLVLSNSSLLVKHDGLVADHDAQLKTIDTGPGHVIIGQTRARLTHDLHLHPGHQLYFVTDTVLDGKHHAISCGQGGKPSIVIEKNATVTLTNVSLNNFEPTSVEFKHGARLIFGDGTTIGLSEHWCMKRVWHCEGVVRVKGNNYSINVGKDGGFFVDVDGMLAFEYCSLHDVTTMSLRCASDTSQLLFDATDLMFDGTFTFDKGGITVNQKVGFHGDIRFAYATRAALKINPYSQLCIYGGVFDYVPANKKRNLLMFADNTSCLMLDDASFAVGAGGVELIRGTLRVKGASSLRGVSNALTGAITFGNGKPADDMTLDLQNAQQFDVFGGVVQFLQE